MCSTPCLNKNQIGPKFLNCFNPRKVLSLCYSMTLRLSKLNIYPMKIMVRKGYRSIAMLTWHVVIVYTWRMASANRDTTHANDNVTTFQDGYWLAKALLGWLKVLGGWGWSSRVFVAPICKFTYNTFLGLKKYNSYVSSHHFPKIKIY